MTEAVTYIRCQINGKWTNLGIVAEENDIQEHFEFVEDLLNEKLRADELEKEKNDAVLALFNQKDYYGKLMSGQKQRADQLESRIKLMRDNYLLMIKDAKEILKNAPEDKLLKFRIRNYEDVVKILNKILESDGE